MPRTICLDLLNELWLMRVGEGEMKALKVRVVNAFFSLVLYPSPEC